MPEETAEFTPTFNDFDRVLEYVANNPDRNKTVHVKGKDSLVLGIKEEGIVYKCYHSSVSIEEITRYHELQNRASEYFDKNETLISVPGVSRPVRVFCNRTLRVEPDFFGKGFPVFKHLAICPYVDGPTGKSLHSNAFDAQLFMLAKKISQELNCEGLVFASCNVKIVGLDSNDPRIIITDLANDIALVHPKAYNTPLTRV